MKVCGSEITYLQLGLDFPDCSIGEATQLNAEREMITVLKMGIKNKPIAFEIDQEVIGKQAEDPFAPLGEGMNAVHFPVNR